MACSLLLLLITGCLCLGTVWFASPLRASFGQNNALVLSVRWPPFTAATQLQVCMAENSRVLAGAGSCGANNQSVVWLPLHQLAGSPQLGLLRASLLGASPGLGWGISMGIGALVLLGAAFFLFGPVSALFSPARVTVVHNPLVHQPLKIFSQTVDLVEVARVDPAVAAVAADLGFGMGIKGGIARKILKILHGTPEPPTDDFDIDCILVAAPGLSASEETELRKTAAGRKMGHLVLEPKDVEVLNKEGLKTYWLHRDICLNEVLLMRLSPGAPLTLFYSDGALHDAKHNLIRSIPHALKSDFTECWALDGAQPILSAKHLARTIVRYFKGQGGASYELGEDTWAYYRKHKLQPITLFQILRPFHGNDETYKAVVTHLINVGLLSSAEVRRKGGFNMLWGATLQEVNDKLAQYGGRLSLDELDAEAVERWIMEKKSRMRGLPYRQRALASRSGFLPADEDTLTLGLVTFPEELLAYIEAPGGLWNPEFPEGQPLPPGAAPPTSPPPAQRPQLPPPLLPSSAEAAEHGTGIADTGDVEPAPVPPTSNWDPSASRASKGSLAQLVSLGGAWAAKLVSARTQRGGGSSLQEPLLSSVLLPQSESLLQNGAAMPPPGGDVQFILAQTFVGSAPAVTPDDSRLGRAWMEAVPEGGTEAADKDDALPRQPLSDVTRTASRYSSMETLHFICRVALAAWPLLVLSCALIVGSVGLHIHQLRIQEGFLSSILNAATAGDRAMFLEKIQDLIRVLVAFLTCSWLSNVVLQLYLRVAMQSLYTGLFNHVIFQDRDFYDRISPSELAMRCGMDAMNLRSLVGLLVQKVVKGITQVIAGATLLTIYARPALGLSSLIMCGAVLVSVGELVFVALVIRGRHRIARSALGRLYGFAHDVFSSIRGVIALALQRTFADSYAVLARSYFRSAMELTVVMSSHQVFLEALFSAGVTVCLLYVGGSGMLSGTIGIGTLYAMLRFTAVVEEGYSSLSEGVARFYASYGSLEHVIDLQQRGQLTNRGKPAVLEALEREDAQSHAGDAQAARGTTLPTRRLTAARWVGGVRCRDVLYGYRGRPGNVLFACNLELQPGAVVLVVGAPGSGRSTLAHLLHLDNVISGGTIEFLSAYGSWLPFQPTTSDRYDLQQRMGFASPTACIEAVFFATLQENMVCACKRLPSVAMCHEAAALTGLDADVANLSDGYQTLVGEASSVDLPTMARLRLGIARLLLLEKPQLILIDDADRFLAAVPRLPEVVARLRQSGASVVLTTGSASIEGVRAAFPDVRLNVLEAGRLVTS